MTDAAISSAFASCGSSNQTHLTNARIFGSKLFRCAIASMTLTGLAASTSMGSMGSQTAAFFKKMKLRNLERLRLIGWIDLWQGMFSRINVVESGLDKGS